MSETDTKISRRTIARGVAWATPAIAVTAASPSVAASPMTTTTSTTLPPCIGDVAATGGTYPVSTNLSGCSTENAHWDFNFRITAALRDETDCDCSDLRVTFFDNPKRSRLWISGGAIDVDWVGSTDNSPRLYVQKVIQPGGSAVFPITGDVVRRVAGPPPYDGFETGGTEVGTITAHGTANDAIHALMLPNGSVPCQPAPGPMAYYQVECRNPVTGQYTPLGGRGNINPCVPMIQSTVCAAGGGLFRLGISVLRACEEDGVVPTDFVITNIQRNGSNTTPTDGTSVWSGNQTLSAGTTNIQTTTAGSGGHLWISFTVDGVNTSIRRVPASATDCLPIITSATNNQTSCPSGNRTIAVTWTGPTTKIQYRVADANGDFAGNWTNQDDTASPGTITLTNATTKCRAVQVRLCNGGTGQTCTSASDIVTVPAVGQGLQGQSEPQTQSLSESGPEPSIDSSTASTDTPEPTQTTESAGTSESTESTETGESSEG